MRIVNNWIIDQWMVSVEFESHVKHDRRLRDVCGMCVWCFVGECGVWSMCMVVCRLVLCGECVCVWYYVYT